MPAKHRIFTTPVANVYPYYLAKVEKNGRTKAEVDTILCWLTSYTPRQLEAQLKKQTDFETFFQNAPKPPPARAQIMGVVCGVRVEMLKGNDYLRVWINRGGTNYIIHLPAGA